jgi:hypothetical protein
MTHDHDLHRRVRRLEHAWPVTVALALAAGISIGSRAGADAPVKQVVLVDGDRKVTLDPDGLRFDHPEEHITLDYRGLDLSTRGATATIGPDRVTLASKTSQRLATLAVDEASGTVSLALANDASHRIRAAASTAATELSVASDRTAVETHAANDARISVRGGGADAELSLDAASVPCWMLAPTVSGKAQRTCNTAK